MGRKQFIKAFIATFGKTIPRQGVKAFCAKCGREVTVVKGRFAHKEITVRRTLGTAVHAHISAMKWQNVPARKARRAALRHAEPPTFETLPATELCADDCGVKYGIIIP